MKHKQELIVTNFVVGDRVRLRRNRVLGEGMIKHFASYDFNLDDVRTVIAVQELRQNGVFVKGACSQSIKYGELFYQECNSSWLERVDEK